MVIIGLFHAKRTIESKENRDITDKTYNNSCLLPRKPMKRKRNSWKRKRKMYMKNQSNLTKTEISQRNIQQQLFGCWENPWEEEEISQARDLLFHLGLDRVARWDKNRDIEGRHGVLSIWYEGWSILTRKILKKNRENLLFRKKPI